MEKDYELFVDCKTYKTDNNGIFDYTDAEISEVNHTTKDDDIYYCRSNETDNISTCYSQIESKKESKILFRARKNKNKQYELINVIKKKMKKNENNINNLDNKMWYVLNSEGKGKEKYENKNKTYYLKENDILKLGRRKYEIIKVNIPIISDTYYQTNNVSEKNRKYGPVFDISLKPEQYCNKIIIKNDLDLSEDGYVPENDCRICFGSQSTEENPKLKLCHCNTYVHYNCLKLFLKNNIKVYENLNGMVTSYNCHKFNCEVCEEPYPLKFTIKFNEESQPRNYYLIDGLELPENTNYLIMESLTYLKEKKNIKNIFVVKLSDRELTLGRSDKNDIIDGDISISRYHAIMKFNPDNGELTLTNRSKYGVLVLIKDNLKLITDEKIYIQVGKSFINVIQKEKQEKKISNSDCESN